MQKNNPGDTVSIHYHGTLEDNTVFDSTRNGDPFEFTLGEGMILPKFEEAVHDLDVGANTTITISAEDAYGEPNDEYIVEVDRSEFPDGFELKPGLGLEIPTEEGEPARVIVTEVTDEIVVLDGNHPLAGKDLTFEIELVSKS